MSPIQLYRDDGPVARGIGGALGSAVPLSPAVLLGAGAIPLFALIAIYGGDAPDLVAGAAIGWAVLMGGIAAGRPHTDRLRWAVPPVLRAIEYGSVLWLGTLAGGAGPPAAFTFLAVVTFHQYDIVYRLRYQGVPPPRWVGDAAGGWEGRLIVAYVLFVAGALPAGLYALAVVLAALFAAESLRSWRHVRREEAWEE
jgi:hypothetical protein